LTCTAVFGQEFPKIDEAVRINQLNPKDGKVRMLLYTDTYNEIDDQFALAYVLLSEDRVSVEAVYAAPFFNSRSSGPSDGMEKVVKRCNYSGTYSSNSS
jgi:hypothetical protein